MEEQKLKELIEKAINKGWVFYGEFSTDVATESVLKLLKEQLHIPVVVRQSEQLPCEHDYQPDITCGVDITCCTKCGDVIQQGNCLQRLRIYAVADLKDKSLINNKK